MGAEVIVSVGTFLDRIERLASEPSVPDGAEARALLATRGLTDGTLDLARDLLTKLGRTEPVATPLPISAEAAEQAEQALWDWYLEWGEIARVAVKDRRALRDLGFLTEKRAGAEVDEGGDEGEGTERPDEGGLAANAS